jgi:hypothetical protein
LRAYYEFTVKHPKGLVQAGKSVGIAEVPQTIDRNWGYIQALGPDDNPIGGKAEFICHCPVASFEQMAAFIASVCAKSKIPASWTSNTGDVVYGISDPTIDVSTLDQQDIELLTSQGFEVSPVLHFNPKKPRVEAPRFATHEAAPKKAAAEKQKRGDRPTLSKIVDDALLGDGSTKSALIAYAQTIYTEKSTDQLKVTITSLISTSATRHGKKVVKTSQDNEAFYKLE